MSCKYCELKMRSLDENTKVLRGESWKDEYGESGYIGQMYDDKFRMAVSYDAGHAYTTIDNIKYCPFCGGELTMPPEPIFDEKIRKGIRAWWDMQDNPFKAASVYCDKKKDLDGFYHWRIFGYIREGEQKESTDLCFRTKNLYEFKDFKDYTKQELCGEEEE